MIIHVLDEAERNTARRHTGTTHGSRGWDMNLSIERAFQEIQRDPTRHPLLETLPAIQPGFRRYVLQRFPYYVVFTILPDELLIVAVAHARRDPGYWLGRTQHS